MFFSDVYIFPFGAGDCLSDFLLFNMQHISDFLSLLRGPLLSFLFENTVVVLPLFLSVCDSLSLPTPPSYPTASQSVTRLSVRATSLS